MGFPVAASSMEFSVMDGLYTTVNLPDNLGIGASHFYAEVMRVKKIATELHAGKALFVLFDELFRGTNVKDAEEATIAVTQGFSAHRNSLFIISSHIMEAGEALGNNNHMRFLYLPTRMNGHTPEYTYTLEEGITDDRHGMIIIRNEGILEILKNGKKNEHHGIQYR
jgi:DNA mismatch repair ATPase MutS